MAYAALIPFAILFLCFAGLRLPLTHASFISLLVGTGLTGTLFQATPAVWNLALSKTFQMMMEIGLILLGAFFFLEVAKRTAIIDSLAQLIRAISPNRLIQAVLVTFPLSLMVEGSSGFGTPLLVIAPILLALEFKIEQCALLPLVSFIIGIPYGALGTPTRLGFPDAEPSFDIFMAVSPFIVITPILTLFLITRRPPLRIILWTLSLSAIYFLAGRPFAASGPELAALGPAFATLVWGLVTTRVFFRSEETSRRFELKGVTLYGGLLMVLWLGKRIFMDQLIPGTSIRIFNPGYVFLLFGAFLIGTHSHVVLGSVVKDTFNRAKRTLAVLFCMTFLVQQLRANGSLELLTHSLPPFLLGSGAPFLGWLGSIFVGTSTMANLLLSKVVDPVRYVSIAGGSAIGVQLAFQSVAAMKSILHDRLSEKQIYRLILPVSLGYILLFSLF